MEPENDEISSCKCNRSRCQGRLKSDSGVSSIISKRVTYISVINVTIVACHRCIFNNINIGLEIYNQVYTAEEDPVNWHEGDKVWFKIKSSFDICTCIKKPLLCGQGFECILSSFQYTQFQQPIAANTTRLCSRVFTPFDIRFDLKCPQLKCVTPPDYY